jgi:tetratricopeptide (TPR) repeat protein
MALRYLGMATDDLALVLDLTSQSLQIHAELDSLFSTGLSDFDYNNLSMAYGNLGLYRKARELGEMAVGLDRAHEREGALAYSLETLARPHFALGQIERTLALLNECIAVSRKLGNQETEASCLHLLGRIMLAQGDARRARSYLHSPNIADTAIPGSPQPGMAGRSVFLER